MKEPAIEARDLGKTFKGAKGGVRALDGVSFEVERGTVFGMLGPNGAGKTTAVRILTTILTPDEGSAEVLGRDVVKNPAEVRSLIGLAGQYAAVDENLSGHENLRMIGQLTGLHRREATRRSVALLAQFELSDAAARSVKTYSGGMRRRLDLAGALVDRPAVLFLDEPTSGLDPYSRAALWGVIEELVKDGTTVLLTTQYLEEADRLADELIVIDHGKVIAQGTSAELKADLGASVLDLEMGTDDLSDKAIAVLGDKLGRAATKQGSVVEIPLDGGPKMVTLALRLLEEGGLTPAGLTVREPSLDDVFLALTGHGAEAS